LGGCAPQSIALDDLDQKWVAGWTNMLWNLFLMHLEGAIGVHWRIGESRELLLENALDERRTWESEVRTPMKENDLCIPPVPVVPVLFSRFLLVLNHAVIKLSW
jgi:hypothetical protein